jgi:hypothetical protein
VFGCMACYFVMLHWVVSLFNLCVSRDIPVVPALAKSGIGGTGRAGVGFATGG